MNELLEQDSYSGVQYYRWGEQGREGDIDLSAKTAVRHLGRRHILALVDDYVLWVTTTDDLKVIINCYKGVNLCLANVEEFQLLAQGLTQLRVYTAEFTARTQSLHFILTVSGMASSISPEEADELRNSPILEPYRAISTAIGIDERGHFLGIVLAHSDDNAAEENVKLLRSRLEQTSSLFSSEMWGDLIETAEIESQGKLTLARLYGISREHVWSFVLNDDPLLLHR